MLRIHVLSLTCTHMHMCVYRFTLNLQSGGLILSTRNIDDAVISDHHNNPDSCRIDRLQTIFKDTTGNVFSTNKPFVVVNRAGKPLPFNHKNQILGAVRPHQFVHCLEDSLRRNSGRSGRKTYDSAGKKIKATRRYLLSHMRYIGRSESRSTGRDKNAVGAVVVGGECNMHTELATPEGVPRNAADLGLAVGDPLFLTLPQVGSDGVFKSNEFMFTPQNPLASAANWTRAAVSPLTRLVLDHVEGILAGIGLGSSSLYLSNDDVAGIIDANYANAVKSANRFGANNDTQFDIPLDGDEDSSTIEDVPQTRDELFDCLVDKVLRKIEKIADHVDKVKLGDRQTNYQIATSGLEEFGLDGLTTAHDLVRRAIHLAFTDRDGMLRFPEALVRSAGEHLDRLDRILGIVRQQEEVDAENKNALRAETLLYYAMLGKMPEFDALYNIHKKSADIVRADLLLEERTPINDLFVGLFMGQLEDGSVKLLQARAG